MGLSILKSTEVNGEKLYEIRGASGIYIVKVADSNYSCTCPSYQYRKNCKHIEYVKEVESQCQK
jgi:uncharacterized Zn finger protein